MRDSAARVRTGIAERALGEGQARDPRIHATLQHLRSLEGRARSLSFLPRQPVRSVLNGRHASRLRGRGLNFEELRDYRPGDDIRSIDWKVTARTGSPHVRVYIEERDRPALIVVDQRMSMFFGSVLNMKAVTAAEAAALTAFRILDQDDRVGGIVFGDKFIAEIRPERNRAALNRFLSALTDANAMLSADAENVDPPISLTSVLRAVARIASHNHLVIVLSDFDKTDEEAFRLVSGIARRNDVILGLITDPFAEDLPRNLRLVVSDGELQAEVDTSDQAKHQSLRDLAHGRLAAILEWQSRLGIPVLPLTSAEDTLTQLRRLMGLAPA